MDDLLDACNMGKGTMYHYVSCKDDIVYLMHQYVMSRTDELLKNLDEEVERLSPTEALCRAIDQHYRFCDELQEYLLFGNREVLYLSKEDMREVLACCADVISFYEKVLRRGIEAGEFKASNPHLMAFEIAVRGSEWATGRWFLKGALTLDEYIRQNTEWTLELLQAGKAP